MEVSMNGLRKHLIADYNSLVRKLNELKDEDHNFPAYKIQNQLDGLRASIVTLAFTYQEGDGGWESMDENTHFEKFNNYEE